jgi:hypothetical protein
MDIAQEILVMSPMVLGKIIQIVILRIIVLQDIIETILVQVEAAFFITHIVPNLVAISIMVIPMLIVQEELVIHHPIIH